LKKVLIIVLIFAIRLSAQIHADSLEYILAETPVNQLSTRFDKQINTFNLNSLLHYSTYFDKTSIHFFENFNSTFIRATEKNIRDDQYFSLSSFYNFNEMLRAGFLGTSSILSDNRRIEINQASTNNAAVFLQLVPYDKIYFSPFAGYSNNRQIGENDYGFIYGAEGLIDTLQLTDMFLSSELKFKNEDISPRKNTLRFISAGAENYFNPQVSNNINFQFKQSRKDFYFEADSLTSARFDVKNNIQSRTETSYFIEDGLRLYNFLSAFNQQFFGRAAFRSIDRDTRYRLTDAASASIFDTQVEELRFELESNTAYNSDFFDGFLRLFYSERNEKHITKRFEGANNIFYEERSRLESSKNNHSTRATLSLAGNMKFSRTDRLSFSLFQNKLRYDTPSDFNFDDRDELLTILRLRYSKQLTPFLEIYASTEGTYNHIVYIFSERSSNNNVNRILRFASGGNYRGKNFTSLNNFEVSANYTVYDFEDLNPNYRSFSFRQFTASDSSILKLNNYVSLVVYGYVKLSEQGDLSWASFSTKPTRFLREIYTEPKIVLSHNKYIISIGARIFSLNTYNYKGRNKNIDTEYLSSGPVAEVIIALQEKLFFRFYGWYEFITIKDNPGKELINFNLQMNWRF